MQISRRNAFTTIRTDGGLLPADLLVRITEGDRAIEGLTPESYHLAKSERLNEAATRAWNRLKGAWEGFRAGMDKLPESDTGTTLTRERWLLILFQELGYGRLQTARAVEIEDKTYPISHIWQATPIHLVSFRQELDRRTPGARGSSRSSPHSLVQEFLNRSDDYLWGFVSNGLRLRLLRDNASLTRAASVDFDLQSMMEGDVYSDFFLLYLLCHQSRVEVPEGKTVEHCWLEKWYNTSLREGTRVLDRLRDGVEQAIEALGGGFLAHPANTALRDKLRDGTLSTQDYYRQVLRIVYRLLFLFVAEDRDLLLLPSDDDDNLATARDVYTRHYSTQRLRRLAERRRSARHADLYHALRLVFARLHAGCPELALPALGSYLFAPTSTPDLNDADIANADLLAAVRNLTFTADGNVRRSVDYRNLGPEELGSVYESLLEMHPDVHLEAGKFELNVAAGSERKTTGSYYTPTSLVNCLLDSALDPVLAEACKKPDPEQALLDLKVCDPACGSGHFLIAAAHRIAKRLAAVRAGEDEPAPESVQHALRDVVGRCIYGVDINPMAVELCKINLWMEALEPGRPLTFLDHHIRCGNSLLGTTPALMKRGIPDEAFKPIEGDDKKVCSELKRRNKDERSGQGMLPFGQPQWLKLDNLVQSFANLTDEDDSTPEALAAKEQRYVELVRSAAYESARLLADAWCAAFVCEKRLHAPLEITESVFRRWEDNPHSILPTDKEELLRLRDQYNFFHWHLAFPEVFKPKPTDQIDKDELTGSGGGFHGVLGNPPWEAADIIEKEFFATRSPDVATARTTSQRQQLIAELAHSNPVLWSEWSRICREQATTSHFWNVSGRFPLGSIGKLNTYRLFAEHAVCIVGDDGYVGQVLKSGIITGVDSQSFADMLISSHRLLLVADFINTNLIFPDVVANERFCLVVIQGAGLPGRDAQYAFTLDQPEQLSSQHHFFTLAYNDISLINPNDKSIPPICSDSDKALVLNIHRKIPALVNEANRSNPWQVRYCQGHLNSSTGSKQFAEYTFEQLGTHGAEPVGREEYALEGLRLLPYYEGKFIGQLNYRFGTFEGVPVSRRFGVKAEAQDPTLEQLGDADYEVRPRYWVPLPVADKLYRSKRTNHPWLFAFRDVCRSVVDARTIQACIMPLRICNHKCCFLALDGSPDMAANAAIVLNCSWATFVVDYVLRQKLPGATFTKGIAYQLPIPGLDVLEERSKNEIGYWAHLLSRGLELSYVSHSLCDFSEKLGYCGPPFRWDEERRFLIRCELDAMLFHLYLGTEREWKELDVIELMEYFPTPRHAVEHIMDTFPIVRRKDEHAHGHYRTKDTILEIYDEMAEVIEANAAAVAAGRESTARYQTRLDPPPGPPTDEAGNFIPMAQWDETIWQRYKDVIHPPREEPVTVAAEAGLQSMAELAYPSTDTDRSICAGALAIVEQISELPSMDHLDALLLATHPDWCELFLSAPDARKLNAAVNKAPSTMFVDEDTSIRWRDARDYLEQRNALAVDHARTGQPITPGSDLAAVKASLPSGVDGLVALALSALNRVKELQEDVAAVSQEQEQVLKSLNREAEAAGFAA